MTRNRLFALGALVAVCVFARAGAASAAQPRPTPEWSDAALGEAAMPDGSGAPYPFALLKPAPLGWATDQGAAPVITVWYGDRQTFGKIGTPQQWINILGSVSGVTPATSLGYRLNGSRAEPLNIGGDRMRLWGKGDFNIELDVSALLPAPAENTVEIIAAGDGPAVKSLVTVVYHPGPVWPLPYTADWSALPSVQAGAQVVDGLWAINGGLLQNVAPGFDRLVAIGDMSWTGYEATVPVTVHAINEDGWSGPSNGAGIGLIARWRGHYQIADEQPRLGWRDLGALAWYHWYTNGTAEYELIGDMGKTLGTATGQPVALNKPYLIKLRVEPAEAPGGTATYRFKMWPAAQPEPDSWLIESAGLPGEPASGSLVLVAHQVMASFGDVQITTLDPEPPAPNLIYLPATMTLR